MPRKLAKEDTFEILKTRNNHNKQIYIAIFNTAVANEILKNDSMIPVIRDAINNAKSHQATIYDIDIGDKEEAPQPVTTNDVTSLEQFTVTPESNAIIGDSIEI